MSNRYDPQAVEDSSSKSEYFSRKDAKWLGVVVLLGVIAAYPLYQWGNEKKNKAVCLRNIKAIGDALNLYAENTDDRYPPLFDADSNGSPYSNNGRPPITWAFNVASYAGARADFRCPSVEENEAAEIQLPGRASAPISYGLYAAHASVIRANVDDPDTTILVAETSNLGTFGSFDPHPYEGLNGQPTPDAFVIGWDNSNTAPDAQTRAVTRLAFRETGNGEFGPSSRPRHSEGIHAVTVSGRRILLTPDRARTMWDTTTLRGEWRSQP